MNKNLFNFYIILKDFRGVRAGGSLFYVFFHHLIFIRKFTVNQRNGKYPHFSKF